MATHTQIKNVSPPPFSSVPCTQSSEHFVQTIPVHHLQLFSKYQISITSKLTISSWTDYHMIHWCISPRLIRENSNTQISLTLSSPQKNKKNPNCWNTSEYLIWMFSPNIKIRSIRWDWSWDFQRIRTSWNFRGKTKFTESIFDIFLKNQSFSFRSRYSKQD